MDESVDARVESWARAHHGVVSLAVARAAGASDGLIHRRVAAGRWLRVGRGVYVLRGWPRTFKQRVMVAVVQAGPGAAASHRCAALLHALDGVRSASVEVTAPRARNVQVHGVLHRSRDLTAADIVEVDGIPTTTITRTLVDLAGDLPLNDLECAYEDAVRRGATSLPQIDAYLASIARPGRPGVTGCRRLVTIAVKDGKRNGSELETRFFQLVRSLGLPLPVRQAFVLRADGRFAYADYAYESHKVVFELQGYEGHSSKKHHRADTERNNMIVLREYRLFEFTWHHVMHQPDYVARVVLDALGIVTSEYRK